MTPTPEEVLSVPCPTCGQPEGSSCKSMHHAFVGQPMRGSHVARYEAVESAAARREEREQMQDWRNDSGV